MAGKGGDYEGWILRLITKAEDLIYSFNMQSWLAFAATKIEEYHGTSISADQRDALLEYRNVAFELPSDIGLSLGWETRFRDDKGRWSKEPTNRPETRMVFRDEGQRFMGKARADSLVQSEIDARGARGRKE